MRPQPTESAPLQAANASVRSSPHSANVRCTCGGPAISRVLEAAGRRAVVQPTSTRSPEESMNSSSDRSTVSGRRLACRLRAPPRAALAGEIELARQRDDDAVAFVARDHAEQSLTHRRALYRRCASSSAMSSRGCAGADQRARRGARAAAQARRCRGRGHEPLQPVVDRLARAARSARRCRARAGRRALNGTGPSRSRRRSRRARRRCRPRRAAAPRRRGAAAAAGVRPRHARSPVRVVVDRDDAHRRHARSARRR